jgi:arylsulfatase A-like enzyme
VLPIPGRPGRLPPRRAVLRGEWKYVEGHGHFRDADGLLFDLGSAAGEAHNLRAERPEEEARLRAALEAHRGTLSRRLPIHQKTRRPVDPMGLAPESAELPPEEMEALRALGYVE